MSFLAPDAPPLSSSLEVLSSLEGYLQLLQDSSSSDEPAHAPAANVLPRLRLHLSRSISSISKVLKLTLDIDSDASCIVAPYSRSKPLTVLRACSILLTHCLSLATSHGLFCEDAKGEDGMELFAQMNSEIVGPLIRSFFVVSTRNARRVLGGQEMASHRGVGEDSGDTAHINSSTRPPTDCRNELLNVLERVTSSQAQSLSSSSSANSKAIPTTAPGPPSSSFTSASQAVVEIPLSGVTVTNDVADGKHSKGRMYWFGGSILLSCVDELLRIVKLSKAELEASTTSSEPTSTPNTSPHILPDSRPIPGVKQDSKEVLEGLIRNVAREETVWYLCALVHVCLQSRPNHSSTATTITATGTDKDEEEVDLAGQSLSSNETNILLQARNILLDVLAIERFSSSSPSSRSRSFVGDVPGMAGGIFGAHERGMVYAVMEALNASCSDATWESEYEDS